MRALKIPSASKPKKSNCFKVFVSDVRLHTRTSTDMLIIRFVNVVKICVSFQCVCMRHTRFLGKAILLFFLKFPNNFMTGPVNHTAFHNMQIQIQITNAQMRKQACTNLCLHKYTSEKSKTQSVQSLITSHISKRTT